MEKEDQEDIIDLSGALVLGVEGMLQPGSGDLLKYSWNLTLILLTLLFLILMSLSVNLTLGCKNKICKLLLSTSITQRGRKDWRDESTSWILSDLPLLLSNHFLIRAKCLLRKVGRLWWHDSIPFLQWYLWGKELFVSSDWLGAPMDERPEVLVAKDIGGKEDAEA